LFASKNKEMIMTDSIGTRLKAARREISLTQEGLADLLEVTRNYIAILETGRKLPGLDILLKMSVLLDTTLDDLILSEPEFLAVKERFAARLKKARGKKPTGP
jgi:transcriptional regulator with XRE-family HTH domain